MFSDPLSINVGFQSMFSRLNWTTKRNGIRCSSPGHPVAPCAEWLRVPVSNGITCGQIWAKLQQLAQGGISDFEVSSKESACYIGRIILAGNIAVVEMTSRPMPPLHSCMVKGSDEVGDGSSTRPVHSTEKAEELADRMRSHTCARCYSCFPEHEYVFEMQVKVNCSASACKLLPCKEQKVCVEHGDGFGSSDSTGDAPIVD